MLEIYLNCVKFNLGGLFKIILFLSSFFLLKGNKVNLFVLSVLFYFI